MLEFVSGGRAVQQLPIQPETLIDWRNLCEQALAERDPAKYLAIIGQLNEIFRKLENAEATGKEPHGFEGSDGESSAA